MPAVMIEFAQATSEVLANKMVITVHVGWILLATFGGLARYLDRYIRKKEVPVWTVMWAHLVVSAFGGYMVASLINLIEPKFIWIGAGIGGYMGTEALDWLSRVLQKKYGGDAPLSSGQRRDRTHYFDD